MSIKLFPQCATCTLRVVKTSLNEEQEKTLRTALEE